MRPKDNRETSVSNHPKPRNNPEDGRIQFNRGGSLRSGAFILTFIATAIYWQRVNSISAPFLCVLRIPDYGSPEIKPLRKHLITKTINQFERWQL
jgi:hypothetical protein